MNVIILDEHQPEDGRIGRHITYLLRNSESVFRLHFSLFNPGLNPGLFSLYGERGFRISPPSSDMRLFNILYFNTMYFLPAGVRSRVRAALEDLGVDLSAPAVLHVHDPVLLKVAIMVARDLLKDARIVYDRHEFYEVFNKKTRLPVLTIPRMYEIMTRDAIDGVVHVGPEENGGSRALFPGAIPTEVPNFPSAGMYDEARIRKKVRSFGVGSPINLLYVGSLNTHDRDVPLMLKIAADVLRDIPEAMCFIGGPAYGHDEELRQMMTPLAEEFRGRFRFQLGYVAPGMTRQLTEDCHMGLHFIKPETTYWIKGSPNKLFEYLLCGAIPVVRASIEASEKISACSLMFDRYTPEEEIISGIRQLLGDPDRCRRMMENALSLGARFTFEAVGKNYLRLYSQVRERSLLR